MEESEYEKAINNIVDNRLKRSRRDIAGGVRAAFQGATFGYGDEIEAMYKSSQAGTDYEDELFKVRQEQEEYSVLNPKTALGLELAGSIPSSFGFAGALGKTGLSLGKQAGLEGFLYGTGVGETSEERIISGIAGGVAGFTVGKLVDTALTGKLGKSDVIADEKQSVSTNSSAPLATETPDNAFIDKDILDVEQYRTVEDPAFRRKPLSEATTAGELYEGVKASVRQFYNDKMRGVSDTLWAEVSPDVGGRYQRASETALRESSKALGRFQDKLVPAIRAINENADAKGALLDYSAGFLGKGDAGIANLNKELGKILNTEQLSAVNDYLNYSRATNARLNKEVFSADFDLDKTYLHTRLSKEQLARIKKEGGISDEVIDDLMDDAAFKSRERGRYTGNQKDPKRPNPLNYDNPIVSDMQRLFKMERLYQLKRMYGVDVNDISQKLGGKSLTPSEFMDAVAITLKNKGIEDDAVTFARKLMVDDIMGQDKTPHPIVQALSSIAYATTLAGPMSALLNVADIPLVGAKYGGRSVMAGAEAIKPSRFKRVPNADLKKAGFDGQHFGEFVSLISGDLRRKGGLLENAARYLREGTDTIMKASGFAAMDQVGKKGVMRGILKSAADDAELDSLSNNWGFYFNDKELEILTETFKKHGDDWTKYEGRGASLAEELMFAGLGQQQLISSAGRPAAWSRNPNLRPLWALRGFVLKQQALALREVVGNIKAGKPEEAAKFLGRYAAYGAGGYAVINEGRQFIFGDGDVSAGGLVRGYGDAWASLLTANTLGLNDYQFGQIKQNGIIPTIAEGLMPIAIDRPLDIGGRAVDVIDRERYGRELLVDTFPIVKQPARLIRNVNEMTGMLGPVGEGAEALLERKPKD